jgi:predicted aconitase with swiveling domain
MSGRANTFSGRPLIPGTVSGFARVSTRGFNSLASFYRSMVEGSPTAICSDQDNPELYGKELTGRILCLPKTTGSTSAGATWDRVASMGIAPKALLFSGSIDSLAAAGLLLADIWVGSRIVAVDRLGEAFLRCVEHDCYLEVRADGSVRVSHPADTGTAGGESTA